MLGYKIAYIDSKFFHFHGLIILTHSIGFALVLASRPQLAKSLSWDKLCAFADAVCLKNPEPASPTIYPYTDQDGFPQKNCDRYQRCVLSHCFWSRSWSNDQTEPGWYLFPLRRLSPHLTNLNTVLHLTQSP